MTRTRLRLTTEMRREWRGSRKEKMSEHLSAGLPAHMKAALRLAAERLTKIEGRRVSMSEVARRLLAAGGIS